MHLGVPYLQQCKEFWCWAAVTMSVADYRGILKWQNQRSLVISFMPDSGMKPTCPNGSGCGCGWRGVEKGPCWEESEGNCGHHLTPVLQSLNEDACQVAVTALNLPVAWMTIKSHLDALEPIILNVWTGNKFYHAIMIVGYEADGAIIWDPTGYEKTILIGQVANCVTKMGKIVQMIRIH